MKAIRVHETGGPERLVLEEFETPSPGKGEVLVRIHVAGVNFIDCYYRSGQYALKTPFTPGLEAAGVVEAVGRDAGDFAPGQRVAYASTPGAYAEFAVVPAARLVKIPPAIDFRSAAAAMLQGMTAHYLCHTTFPLNSTHATLVHAGAGGVGLLLIQMARKLGARVFATVSTEAKARLALDAGAEAAILYTSQDFLSEVHRLTGGQGVDVVYDSVGKETFFKSLDCLKRRGYLVLYGASSGPVSSFDPGLLSSKGSLFLTRPILGDYVAARAELERRAADVFAWILDGTLKLRMVHDFPLAEAPQAHRLLQGRTTTGKVILIP